jgi:hypothetical protein
MSRNATAVSAPLLAKVPCVPSVSLPSPNTYWKPRGTLKDRVHAGGERVEVNQVLVEIAVQVGCDDGSRVLESNAHGELHRGSGANRRG